MALEASVEESLVLMEQEVRLACNRPEAFFLATRLILPRQRRPGLSPKGSESVMDVCFFAFPGSFHRQTRYMHVLATFY